MIILGIDPGTATTGYAIVDASKKKPKLITASTVSTLKDDQMHNRLERLFNGLTWVCKEYSPSLMVIERLFFNTNVKTAITVGQARGVALLTASQFKMDVIEYTALQAKLVLTGYGRAQKKEMQEAVKAHLNLSEIIKPDDASDAVAMVLCHISKTNSQPKVKTK